nr:unnamed protein product [Callosobruchus analis]
MALTKFARQFKLSPNPNRKKDLVLLDKHMIYCGATCALKQDEREEEIVLLRQEMVELQKENVEKEKYIDSLRKKSSAFEEDVIDIETSYRDEIQSNQRVISNLNIMLDEKDRRIAALNEELQELKHSKEVLQDEIYKLKNIDEAKRFKCEKRPNFRKTSPKGDSSNQTNGESASPNTDSQCNPIHRDASCTSKIETCAPDVMNKYSSKPSVKGMLTDPALAIQESEAVHLALPVDGSDPADVLNSSGPEDNTSFADPPFSPNSASCCDSSAQSDESAAFVLKAYQRGEDILMMLTWFWFKVKENNTYSNINNTLSFYDREKNMVLRFHSNLIKKSAVLLCDTTANLETIYMLATVQISLHLGGVRLKFDMSERTTASRCRDYLKVRKMNNGEGGICGVSHPEEGSSHLSVSRGAENDDDGPFDGGLRLVKNPPLTRSIV